MGIYAKVALAARERIINGMNPELAWNEVIREFTTSIHSINKGCPKSAFLGLCEDGYIKGVNSGHYTNSTKNKRYAIKAVELLRRNPYILYSNYTLWINVLKELDLETKSYSQQMDVVLALWKSGCIM